MSKSEGVGDDDDLAHHVEGQEEQPLQGQQQRRRRWKRQGRNGRKSKAHSTNIERNLLMNYLKEYRDLVLERYREPLSNGRKIRAMMDSGMMSSMEPIVIGRQEFPRLDDHYDDVGGDSLLVLDRPYLALPSGLSPGMRAVAHDLCMELGLFHCSVGEAGTSQRYVAVSVFRDGLTFVPGIADGPVILAEMCKPWIKRKRTVQRSFDDEVAVGGRSSHTSTSHGTDDNVMTAELASKCGKEKIMELVDQPSLCWRDGIDEMDLIELKDKDLSDTTPPESEDPSFMLVDSAKLMQVCIHDLEKNKPTELAFDLEGYCKSKDLQITCLIQLATNDGREYVIDVLAEGVWDCVGELSKIFSDRSVVKIGHGIGGFDVQSLHRDFGIFVVNAFDTHEAAKTLRLKDKGLAKICCHYGMPFGSEYQSLKDEYQNCDWTRRPLTLPMIHYGRYDVRFLSKIRHLMIRDLVLLDQSIPSPSHGVSAMMDMMRAFNEGDGIEGLDEADNVVSSAIECSQNIDQMLEAETERAPEVAYLDAKNLRKQLTLMQVISSSQERCSELWSWNREVHRQNSMFLSMTSKAKANGDEWTQAQFDLYERLANWRDLVADAEECLPGFVCQSDFLALIAHYRPGTEILLRRLLWHTPRLLTRKNEDHMSTLLSLVQQSRSIDDLEDEMTPPSYKEYCECMAAKKASNLNVPTSDWGTERMLLTGIATSCIVAIAIGVALSKTPKGRYT
jgi:ribonuclease D